MTKNALALLAILVATVAHAQGPGPGPGPGPTPDPWVVNGSAISYNGCVLVPASVTGGCKGNGTINATAIYQAGFQVLGTLANGKIFVGNASAVGIAQTPSGDLTMTNAGVFTISANAVTNAKLAQAAATTLKGNPTNATANVQDFTFSGLSALASPSMTLDLLLIWDHTAGTFKSVTPSAITTAVGGITALTGDVVATGPGSVAATIQPGVVTYAKFQTVAANSIVGNPTAGLATSQAISLGTTLTFSGTALQTTAHTGDVTSPANSNVMTLVTAQSGAHTWAATQTFTLAPVFTDQAGSRTALGLGTAAVQNTGTSGANVPLLSGANTWGAVQTLPSPALTGTVTGSNTIPLSILQQSAANTMLGNWTGSTANVVANSMPSCADTGGNHLNYVAGTGITCGTGIGNGITALTGDVTATGPGSVSATLATVNANVGSFGSSTAIPTFTVNAKGLITAASTSAVIAPAGTVTGTTLASNVVTSSLTTVGALGAGSATTGFTINAANVTWSGQIPGASVAVVANASGSPSATFGVMKGDGTTIQCTSGTCSAVGGVATSVTVGTTTVNSASGSNQVLTTGTVVTGIGTLSNTATTALVFGTGTLNLSGNLATTGAFNPTFAIPASVTYTFPGAAANLAALDIASQTITGGAIVTSLSQSTGNITVNCGSRPIQYIINGGAYTITAPANDGSCLLFVTNNGSAGATTFSGFTVGTNTGAALTTTNTSKFTISVWRINGTSGYSIFAHQ